MLAVSLFAGSFIASFISQPQYLSAAILFVLGSIKIFDCVIKSTIKKSQGEKKIKFSLWDINFILTIYENPHMADADESRHISSKEAVALAIALALDNMAVGLGAGLVVNPAPVIFANFVIGTLAIVSGLWLGAKFRNIGIDLSWVGGLTLIAVGVFTIF
jgi:putative sporulation protein YtaF